MRGIKGVAIFLIAIAVIMRFMYPSPFAATWDEVDFALALDEYDLMKMQPHFPGYPFFILGGMLLHRFVSNPTEALALFNAVMAASALIPMYKLARRYVDVMQALIVTAVLQTSSYFSILVTQPMSEGAALSIVWWYLWALSLAFVRKEIRFQIVPVVLFALLMGLRLSYAPFGFGLLFLFLCRHNRNGIRISFLVLLAALLQMGWISALVWNVGGVEGLLKIAFGFVQGHFTEWGGAMTETEEPLISRLYRLVVVNLLYVGFFSKSIFSMAVFVLILIFLILSQKRHEERFLPVLLFSITVIYFIWNLFAQNIDKPRHSYPIVMLLLFLISVWSMKRRQKTQWLLLLFSVTQMLTGYSFVQQQSSSAPATYQLAQYLETKKKPLIVYTWEETRVMQYLHVPYDHKRFYRYDYYLQDKKYRQNDTIYVTNHLVNGFYKQGVELDGKIEKVAEFRSEPLFDPVYSKIILYIWRE